MAFCDQSKRVVNLVAGISLLRLFLDGSAFLVPDSFAYSIIPKLFDASWVQTSDIPHLVQKKTPFGLVCISIVTDLFLLSPTKRWRAVGDAELADLSAILSGNAQVEYICIIWIQVLLRHDRVQTSGGLGCCRVGCGLAADRAAGAATVGNISAAGFWNFGTFLCNTLSWYCSVIITNSLAKGLTSSTVCWAPRICSWAFSKTRIRCSFWLFTPALSFVISHSGTSPAIP